MDTPNKIDILIVGGGPIGLACGIEAKKAGLSYVILEKGCLVNSLYNYPANMTFFSTSEKLEIGGVPFISHGDKPTRSEALEYYRRVQQSWELKVNLYEKVEKVTPGTDTRFQIKSSKATYNADSVIVATGFYDKPNLMNIPGEDLPKVKHYYDEPHPYANQRVLVVGAANSSVDVALETYRKGAEVTMVVREEEISSRVKYWVRPDIDNRIKEGSIKAYFKSEMIEIKEHEVIIKTSEGLKSIPNDFVMAMTGYQPDFSFLQNIGIELCKDETRKPMHNEETYETNIAGLYLAGVVCGGMITTKWFIENSREHAEIVIRQIQGEKEVTKVN
ncbi:YpdA family putative bacillithiol disulfide reductase [Chondrinema litorale]|uniref:YpdA family putative bacillithiol disulfide reductase n=1 Tax=Chondrinema litorale TaxID=2994555 RepID=UPI0025447FE1|nr:YpdA family putative bacillithiol disulfide reductase [Chondrinema litorale]UZR95028.1 YpdA family putative bacillithiol disulfide reductase [Chondrinema litorale]